jgi:16S rRNA (uracil1498-N3)-methyltransferase
VPEVRDPVALPGLCALAGRSDAELLVLHPGGEAPLSAWARVSAAGEAAAAAAGAAGLAGRSEIAVVVGPEGGLGDDELAALAAAGARVLRLGETVLRTSSAGPAALAVLNAALGRW